MSILSRIKLNSSQRLDLEDMEALQSALRTDSKFYTKSIISNKNLIVKGFAVSGVGFKQATVSVADATLIIPEGTDDFSWFTSAPADADIVVPDASLVDGTRNYLELVLLTEDNTPLSKAFWNPDANSGAGAEFNQIVNTITDLKVVVETRTGGFSGDPDKIPLAYVDTDPSGNIVIIKDYRSLFGRLSKPNDLDYDYAWGTKIDPTSAVVLSGVSGTFVAGETINIGSETAKVVTGGTSSITVNEISGDNFARTNTVTGLTSGATGALVSLQESFVGVDKSTNTLNEILEGILTEIKSIKGTRFHYQDAANSLNGITDNLNSLTVQAVVGAKYVWDGAQLQISDESVTPLNADVLGYIRILGRSGNLSMTRQDGFGGSTTIPVAEGSVLYVKIPTSGSRTYSGTGSGNTNYQTAPIGSFVNSDENYWIGYRELNRLYLRGYGEIEAGEEIIINDPMKEDILAQMAANQEKSNEDRSMKLIEGGTWSYAAGISGSSTIASVSLPANAFVAIDTASKLIAQSFTPSSSVNLNQILVHLRKAGSPVFNTRIKIYPDSGGNPNMLLQLGQTGTIAAASLPTDFTTKSTYTMTSPLALTSGQKYWFVINAESVTTLDAGNHVQSWYEGTADGLAGQSISTSANNGSSWSLNPSSRDLNFDALAITTGTDTLTFSADAYIDIPGITKISNRIVAGSIALPNANSVAYVQVNRDSIGAATLSVTVADMDSITLNDNIVVIARKVSAGVLVGQHCFLLKDGEYLELDGALAEINRVLGQLRLKPHLTDLNKVLISTADVTLLDNSKLAQVIGTYLLKFDGAVINLSTGVVTESDGVTALGNNFTPFSIPSGQYFYYGISLVSDSITADNRQSAKVQVDAASAANATQSLAPRPQITGDIKLGALLVRNNAGSIERVEIQKLGVGSGSGGSKSIKAKYMDPVSSTLPSGVSATIDGSLVVNGDEVLFTNLSSNNNRIYKVSGVGVALVWTETRPFSGQPTPTDGDSVRVTSGTGFADQLTVFDGTNFKVNDIVRYFNGADYWEQTSIKTMSLLDATTADVFSVSAVGSENFIIGYSVFRGTEKETGHLYITTDGTNVQVARSSANIGNVLTEFTGNISLGTLHFQYTTESTGSAATMKYFVQRWSNSAGGPAGIPSYSSGGGSVAAAGAVGEIQFHGTSGNLDADSRLKWDGTLGAIDMNGMKYGVLSSSITLADGQITPSSFINFSKTLYRHVVIEYSVERGGEYRTGRFLISNNGTTTGFSDDFVETSPTGLTFSASVISLNVHVEFTSTNTGNTANFKYTIKRWA